MFHVSARAVFRQLLFNDDEDRLLFLELLAETIARHHWRCHAYCLMGTHYHLMIECARADLSEGVQWLNGVYAQRCNRRHSRYGHLFCARFDARAIQDEGHYEAAMAYVLANPAAAGLTDDPDTWPWSGMTGPHRRKRAWTNTRSTAKLTRAWLPTSSSSTAPASTT